MGGESGSSILQALSPPLRVRADPRTAIHAPMNSIVTFYSYKGGVGRSMALANIAILLAQRGLKVLVVDFDLEAPGLERYFSYFEIKQGGPGLLRMCMDARETGTADYTRFTST